MNAILRKTFFPDGRKHVHQGLAQRVRFSATAIRGRHLSGCLRHAATGIIFLLGVPALSGTAGASEVLPVPEPARRSELVVMVRQDCGSCHGMKLKGGLGPPLLPESLAGKDAGSLAETIHRGRPGTAMPPWQRFLTRAEADWIVSQLQKGFPNE